MSATNNTEILLKIKELSDTEWMTSAKDMQYALEDIHDLICKLV